MLPVIWKIPQSNIVRAFVTGYPGHRTVEFAAQEFHATCQPGNHSIVTNGDGWKPDGTSQSIWAFLGRLLNKIQNGWRPLLRFDRNHKMGLKFVAKPYYYPENIETWSAFSLTRRLVINGAINPAWTPKETWELNARLGFGITDNNELVIAFNDGWDKHHSGLKANGWATTSLGLELIKAGVIEGGDADGGGSMTIAVDGVVINDWYNDGEGMRPVVNHLCLELKELPGDVPEPEPEPPPTSDFVWPEKLVAHQEGDTKEYRPINT